MEKRRGESRKARAKTGMPVVSLVGYTNVGKSSLMNALCGPSVAEADMLFATLDPTSRKLVLPSGMAVLLVDTVGFVSRLPHNLVEAFKSTLEEAAWSDVIVRVADAGDDQREEQLAITDEVLDGLDCADIPRLTVYNKCDKPNALNFDPDILLTSAKTGYGLDALLKKLDELLSDRVHTIRVLLPYDKLGLAAPCGSGAACRWRNTGRTGCIWKASSKPRTCTVLRDSWFNKGNRPLGSFPTQVIRGIPSPAQLPDGSRSHPPDTCFGKLPAVLSSRTNKKIPNKHKNPPGSRVFVYRGVGKYIKLGIAIQMQALEKQRVFAQSLALTVPRDMYYMLFSFLVKQNF